RGGVAPMDVAAGTLRPGRLVALAGHDKEVGDETGDVRGAGEADECRVGAVAPSRLDGHDIRASAFVDDDRTPPGTGDGVEGGAAFAARGGTAPTPNRFTVE